MSGAQQRPQAYCSCLYEVGDEEAHQIPKDCDREAGSIPPRAISACQNDHGNVYQCLEGMKHTQFRIENGRYEQRQKKESCPDNDPCLRRAVSVRMSTVPLHATQYGCAT